MLPKEKKNEVRQAITCTECWLIVFRVEDVDVNYCINDQIPCNNLYRYHQHLQEKTLTSVS